MADNTNHSIYGHNVPAEYTIFDISDFLERVDENKDVAKELLALFLQESHEAMNLIRLAPVDSLGSPSITMQAHKIKGMCKDIGGEHVAYLAGQLEKIENQSDPETHQHLKAQLFNAYNQLCEAVSAWIEKNS